MGYSYQVCGRLEKNKKQKINSGELSFILFHNPARDSQSKMRTTLKYSCDKSLHENLLRQKQKGLVPGENYQSLA